MRFVLAAVMALVVLCTAVASAPYKDEAATATVPAPAGSTSWA